MSASLSHWKEDADGCKAFERHSEPRPEESTSHKKRGTHRNTSVATFECPNGLWTISGAGSMVEIIMEHAARLDHTGAQATNAVNCSLLDNSMHSPPFGKYKHFACAALLKVKHELWLKLHETSASCQLQKGQEAQSGSRNFGSCSLAKLGSRCTGFPNADSQCRKNGWSIGAVYETRNARMVNCLPCAVKYPFSCNSSSR